MLPDARFSPCPGLSRLRLVIRLIRNFRTVHNSPTKCGRGHCYRKYYCEIEIMRNSRNFADVGLVAAMAILFLLTRQWKSVLTILLPACVTHWIIAR
jgi:hypothetical protein